MWLGIKFDGRRVERWSGIELATGSASQASQTRHPCKLVQRECFSCVLGRHRAGKTYFTEALVATGRKAEAIKATQAINRRVNCILSRVKDSLDEISYSTFVRTHSSDPIAHPFESGIPPYILFYSHNNSKCFMIIALILRKKR